MDVSKFIIGELILVWTDLRLLQESKEPKLVLVDEEKGSALATSTSSSTANSMDVVLGIIWWVELHDPVNIREIETSLSNIGAKKDTRLSLSKLKISGCSLLLLLFSMDILYWNVYIVKEITIKLHSITA